MNKTFALLCVLTLLQAPLSFAEDSPDLFSPPPAASLADKNISQLQQALVYYQNAATQPWQTISNSTHFKVGKKNKKCDIYKA